MPTPCYLLERNGLERAWLRRYAEVGEDETTGCSGTHDALAELGDFAEGEVPQIADDDDRWPSVCTGCGCEFAAEAIRQVFTLHLYAVTKTMDEAHAQTGAVFHIHPNQVFDGAAPAGAMWYADWMIQQQAEWDPANAWWHFGAGADGHALCVRTPGGDWLVDSRASNCSRPDDNTHRCWCRAGDAPNVSVTKDCDTCAAGAGSIVAGSYHGFLQAGVLT